MVKDWLITENAIAFMSDSYAAQGWNRINGTPEEKTLEGLGLEDANNTLRLPIETEGINYCATSKEENDVQRNIDHPLRF